ncbi:MAG: hypothetical protein WC428_01970 [Candidatus Paceibacterota bacterium]
MNIYERIAKIVLGLSAIFFGVRLMYYLVHYNKIMDIPEGLSFVGFMSMCMLLLLGVFLILWAFEDKLNK